MHSLATFEPVDYLLIGHLTIDLTPQGKRLGGTAAYSALTARALGLRVGVVTSWAREIPLDGLEGIAVSGYSTEQSTTFENLQTPQGRQQIVHHVADRLDFHMVPETWRSAPIVHLGPVAQEVEPSMVRYFHTALIGLTPQGWLRTWDAQGVVHQSEWPEAGFLLNQAGAVVLSIEDVNADESRIEEMVTGSRLLVVTEGANGARVYWNGDVRRFRRPPLEEVDPTGAGDIFAAAFFTRLHTTRDPWEAARFAVQIAGHSVTRPGLSGIPTPDEIEKSLVEVF